MIRKLTENARNTATTVAAVVVATLFIAAAVGPAAVL